MYLVTLVDNNNTNHRISIVCIIDFLDDMDKIHAYLQYKMTFQFEKAPTAKYIEKDKEGIYSRDKNDFGIYLRVREIDHINDLYKQLMK